MSEQAPEPDQWQQTATYDGYDVAVPQMDWIEKGGRHDDLETK